MFGIGLPEFILIMAVALIVVGPEKLPELAKTVAKQVLELKKAASALKNSFQEEVSDQGLLSDEPFDMPDQPVPRQFAEEEGADSGVNSPAPSNASPVESGDDEQAGFREKMSGADRDTAEQ